MKKFKKIMAVLVAAMMIVAMAVPAWADLEPETATNTITITVNTNKANSGTTGDTVDDPTSLPDKDSTTETYTAFKIFEVTKDLNTKGDTTNDTIDAQYQKVTSLVTPQYDANAKYYTQSTTTPHEYTEVSVTAENFDSLKPTLYIESPSTTKGVAYFLRSTSPWYGVADVDVEVLKYLKFTPTADGSGKVVEWIGGTTAASEANARKLADALLALIHSNGSGGYYVGSDNSRTLAVMTESEGKYVGDYKALSAGQNSVCVGYYLISSGLGSNLILATSDIAVTEKNTYPTVDKQIIKTDDDAANLAAGTRATDAQIGDAVKYQLTVVLPDEANQGFELHDVMGAGLTLKLNGDSTFVVKCNGTAVEQNNGESTPVAYWTIQYIAARASGTNSQTGVTANTVGGANSNLAEGDAFVVKFTDAWVNHADRTADETYTIEYEAIVNKDAVLATANSNNNNENKVNLKYSNYTTPYVSTKVYTHEFDLVKYYMNGDTATTLSGAQFEMYRDTQIDSNGKLKNGAAKMNFVKSGNTYRVVEGVSTYPQNTETTTTLTSSDGTYDIEGLDVGDYYLLETYAPNGYNKLQYMTKVTVSAHESADVVEGTDVKQSTSASGTTTVEYTMNENAHTGDAAVNGTTYTVNTGVGVVNTAGTVLPSTGGMGTTVLYIVGGMLVVLAGAYLFFSRKKTA